MRYLSFKIILLSIFILVLSISFIYTYNIPDFDFQSFDPKSSFNEYPHSSGNAVGCEKCHNIHNPVGPNLTIYEENGILCISCHTPGGYASSLPFSASDRADPYGLTTAVTDFRGTSHAWAVPAINSTAQTTFPSSSTMLSRVTSAGYDGNIVCSTCHNQHSDDAGLPFMRISNTNDAMCLDCHAARNVQSATGNSHPVGIPIPAISTYTTPTTLPFSNGTTYCTTCHGVHYTDSGGANSGLGDGYLLRFAHKNLCKECHVQPLNTVHLSTTSGALWPGGQYGSTYSARTATSERGACFNCHWAHGWPDDDPPTAGADYARLLVDEEENLCFTCHDGNGPASDNIYAKFTTNNTPGSSVAKTNQKLNTHHDIFDADTTYSGAKIECTNCHNAHSATTTSKFVLNVDTTDGRTPAPGNTFTGSSLLTEFCFECHDGSYGQGVTPPTNALVDLRAAYLDTRGGAHGINTGRPTLKPGIGWAEGDIVPCEACHDIHGSPNLFSLKTTIYTKNGLSAVTSDSGSTYVRVTTNTVNDLNFNGYYWCNTCHTGSMGSNRSNCFVSGCHHHGENI